tara:strand:- start:170 stop:343 length:174 start_codon:yes stop_codon:yes gene_type:complete
MKVQRLGERWSQFKYELVGILNKKKSTFNNMGNRKKNTLIKMIFSAIEQVPNLYLRL